jgi:hypothetical protein
MLFYFVQLVVVFIFLIKKGEYVRSVYVDKNNCDYFFVTLLKIKYIYNIMEYLFGYIIWIEN